MWKLCKTLLWIINDPWGWYLESPEPDGRIEQFPKELQKLIRKRGRQYLQYQPLFWLGGILAMMMVVVEIAWFIETPWLGAVGLLAFLPIYWFCYLPALWRAIDRYLYDHSESGRMKQCSNCEYDLRGTDGDQCPECGTDNRIVHIRYATRHWKMRD